ncbi:MAG: alpha/beta hydrolase [Thiotrichaceae bacterium]|nr:alpha/beta hydrolase [Thiotrichaceae bacterium]
MITISKISSIIVFLTFTIAGCKAIVNYFAFHPNQAGLIATENLPANVEEITVTTEDQVKIISLYLPYEGSEKLLIYFHGNAGNIYHRMPSLLHLQKSGFNIIGASYRGYGKSDGSPSEAGIYLDGKAIYQYAIEKLGFSTENIVILGRSIGSTVAINLAQHKKLHGLILISPLSNGKEQANASGLRLISSLAGNAFDNLTKIDNLNSPLLVIHGTRDHVVPFAMGEKIFSRAKTEKKFIGIDGAGHNNLHNAYSKEYWTPILQFMNEG